MNNQENNLNRSFSAPDIYNACQEFETVISSPFVRRVHVVEEFYRSNSPVLLRQISCEQIYSPNKYTLQQRNNVKRRDLQNDSNFALNRNFISKSENNNTEDMVTPMDIDPVASNEEKVNINNIGWDKNIIKKPFYKKKPNIGWNLIKKEVSDNPVVKQNIDSKKEGYEKSAEGSVSKHYWKRRIKNNPVAKQSIISNEEGSEKSADSPVYKNNSRRRIKNVRTGEYQEPKNLPRSNLYVCNEIAKTETISKNHWLKYFICSLFLILAIILLSSDIFIFVNHEEQISNIKQSLKSNVYQQDSVINKIIKTLEDRRFWPNKMKVLSLIGTNGVGKTFIANLLKQHFHPALIHELQVTQLGKNEHQNRIIRNIQTSHLNLVILDDLYLSDIESALFFIDSLPKDKFILVLTIFSIQYADDDLNYLINTNDIYEIREKLKRSKLNHDDLLFNKIDKTLLRANIEEQMFTKHMNDGIRVSKEVLDDVLENHDVDIHGYKGLYPKILLEIEKRQSFGK